jgi:amino acid efflux transporter
MSMSGLKQELGLAQGVGLLSTSLLGTGVFAVPALAALVAGNNSLWAWPVLIVLVFPWPLSLPCWAAFPSAGGVAHFVGMAFGPRLERVTGWLFLGDPGWATCGAAYRHRLRPGAVWLA